MSGSFGKTWWGEQWLNSLNNIDYSNRLPRGASYARKGAVEKISNFSVIRLPEQINAVLLPYQQRGFSWIYRNGQIGFGSVLADDMGLGKTLQVIATILKFKEEGFPDR